MKNKVFAIVGMPGAGKSVVAGLFKSKGCRVVRFGDLTEDELRRRGIAQTPESERIIREEIRASEGMDAYARRNAPRIEEALLLGHVAADGLYSWSEYLFMRDHFGDRFEVVAVVSAPAARHERLAVRPIRPLSKDEALRRDFSEIENIQKAGPIAMADHVLLNEGPVEDLARGFEELWARIAGRSG